MEFAKAEYTEVWTNRAIVPLIYFADRVRAIMDTGLDHVGLAGVEPPASVLRALESFDSVISWYGANRQEFRGAVAGLPFAFFPALPDSSGSLHAADFFALQVGAPLPSLPRIFVERATEDYAVIHPFSGGRKKNWPLESYRELARRLPLPIRWCAGPEEELEGAIRFDGLDEVAQFLGRAKTYIGNDSGITHLAAAVGIPTVALFSSTNPVVWAPRGANVRVLQDATVDDVLGCVRDFLSDDRLEFAIVKT